MSLSAVKSAHRHPQIYPLHSRPNMRPILSKPVVPLPFLISPHSQSKSIFCGNCGLAQVPPPSAATPAARFHT